MKNTISFAALLLVLAAVALAGDKPQDARAAIAASPEAIKAYLLKQFAPAGYSIDSDSAAQLKISRALSDREKGQWQVSHWITGGQNVQCRRVHTLIMLPNDAATDVIMRWETVCTQPGGREFRAANTSKKEVEWMQGQLESAKGKLEGEGGQR